VPELPRENRVREVKRRGRFDGRQKLLRVLCLSNLNNVRLPPIPPVSAAKQNGAGSDLVLNDCLAYPRFGRYWPISTFSPVRLLPLRTGADIGQPIDAVVDENPYNQNPCSPLHSSMPFEDGTALLLRSLACSR
jgi:hypothetical protein